MGRDSLSPDNIADLLTLYAWEILQYKGLTLEKTLEAQELKHIVQD